LEVIVQRVNPLRAAGLGDVRRHHLQAALEGATLRLKVPRMPDEGDSAPQPDVT
jgi:hypothetical protein